MAHSPRKRLLPTKPPSYFEAIIQLRECKDEVANFTVKFIDNQKDPDYFIAKTVPLKTGLDLYLSSNKLAVKVAAILPKKFGGRVQTSSRLFGYDRQHSKNLMRFTAVYRGLDFEVNSVLALPVKRTVVKVLELGTTVRVKDMKTGKHTGFVPNRTHYRILETHKTRVVRVNPTIQVLEPETYQPIDTKNSPDVLVNREVKVANYQGWWIVK